MPSHNPTDIAAEFYIDRAWRDTYDGIDLAARIRGNDMVRISRGLVDHQSAVSPTQVTFTLNNNDGLFTDDNPLSPLWGKIGLNTRFRFGVKSAAGNWDEYVRFPDYYAFQSDDRVDTADKASLDITGDIDVRFEISPYYTRGFAQVVAGKWDLTANQRSWLVTYEANGEVKLWTSPDGTFGAAVSCESGTFVIASSTVRTAFRITLDVNNGAGGRTYNFYSADTIAGPWSLESTATIAATTSIFSSTADLEIGSANGGNGVFSDLTPWRGKVHAAEVYSGIAGTLVADFKPAGQGLDATSWVDTCASPNTWTLTGSYIRLGSDRIRITGEMNTVPDSWDVTGEDRRVQCVAQGVLNRYQNNSAPLSGAIYRNYRNYPDLTGYWRMEDEAGATQAATSIPGSQPGGITSCTFGSADDLAGSTGAITLSSAPNVSKIILRPKTVTNSGETSFLFYMHFDNLNATEYPFVTLLTPGATAARWVINISSTTFSFAGYEQDGTLISSAGTTHGAGASPLDHWVGMQFTLIQEGANVRWRTSWHAVESAVFYTHNPGGTTYAGNMKQFNSIIFDTPVSDFAGAQVAHAITANFELDLVSNRFAEASRAYGGETFINRGIRLGIEENVYFEWLGDPDQSEVVGPQPADKLSNILAAGAKVDGGILGEPRDKIGYQYISRRALGNRRGLELSYADSHLADPPAPINDNRYTVNDFTASRPSGSSARYVADDNRRKNVREPDDPTSPGVGRFELADSFGADTDDQLDFIAQQMVSFGTWEERRIPNLSVGLHRSEIYGDAVLLREVIAHDCGDPVGLIDLEDSPLPPDILRMCTFGYTEEINNHLWNWVANTVPQGPYDSPVFGGMFDGVEPRLDATGNSVVHAPDGVPVSSAATSITIRTPAEEPAWVDTAGYAAEFPFDIKASGERMTLTAATASTTDGTLLQGTFETGVAGWLTTSCTFVQSAVFADTGSFSGLMTVTGAPSLASVRVTSPTYSPRVDEGDSVTIAARVRSVAALTNVHVYIDWKDEDNVFISQSAGAVAALASGSWQSRSLTATAPAGAYYAQYGVVNGSSPAAGALLYIDNVTFSNAGFHYQTLTVTRSVDGIVKEHSDGESVWPYYGDFLGRG